MNTNVKSLTGTLAIISILFGLQASAYETAGKISDLVESGVEATIEQSLNVGEAVFGESGLLGWVNPMQAHLTTGASWVGTTTGLAITLKNWMQSRKLHELMIAAAPDAAEYVASNGEKETTLLVSVREGIRSYGRENQIESIHNMSDLEIAFTILETVDAAVNTDENSVQ